MLWFSSCYGKHLQDSSTSSRLMWFPLATGVLEKAVVLAMLRWLYFLGGGNFQSSSSPEGPPSLKCRRLAWAVGGPGWMWRLRFCPQRTRHSMCKAPLLAHPPQIPELHSRPALGPNVLTYPSPIHLSPLVTRSFFSKTVSLFLFPGCIHLYRFFHSTHKWYSRLCVLFCMNSFHWNDHLQVHQYCGQRH